MSERRSKRILIFSMAYYPNFVGGAEVAIKEITDRLNPQEYEFDMITLGFQRDLPKIEKIGNVTVYRIGFTGKGDVHPNTIKFPLSLNKYWLVIAGFFKALHLNKKHKYDAIWSMMATYNSFAAILFKFVKPKIPYLLTLQEGDPIGYIKKRARPLYPLFVSIFKRADHIQVISKYLEGYAREMGYTGEVSIVPNAVDFKYFAKRDEEKIQIIKEEFNKKEDDFWLITTSRLVYKNAVDDVVRAMALLPKNVKFLILGMGPDKDKLEILIDELEIADRVYFFGYVDHEDMPAFLHASDAFIRPSRSEGFGNSFVEAMAADIPVIATSEGGIVDFLSHNETGLICGTNDPTDIALKVEILIKDINLREEIIDNAREMVKEKYDWNLITEQMRTVFKKLAK